MYSLRRRYRGFFKSSFPSVTEAIFGQAEVFFFYIILAWVSGVSGEKGKDGSEKGRPSSPSPSPI